jgi:hypothetical protein
MKHKIFKIRLFTIMLIGLMMLGFNSNGQEFEAPQEDYCSGIKIIKGHRFEHGHDGKIHVILICSCGPGHC